MQIFNRSSGPRKTDSRRFSINRNADLCIDKIKTINILVYSDEYEFETKRDVPTVIADLPYAGCVSVN